MKNLWDKLNCALSNILSGRKKLTGPKIIKELFDGDYGFVHENRKTITQYLYLMSRDPANNLAKVSIGQGYYLRDLEEEEVTNDNQANGLDSDSISTSRGSQREEKFRAIYIRHEHNQARHPMLIEHTRGKKRTGGLDRWKFPDVVSIDWDAVTFQAQFDSKLLKLKRGLGAASFRLVSVELKVWASIGSLRKDFFQTVSNSRWAHDAQLVFAGSALDTRVAKELARLGTSYGVSVLSYGFTKERLDSLPSADIIGMMSDVDFEEQVGEIEPVLIATVATRKTLDWEHLRDLRGISPDFEEMIDWISICLSDGKPYTIEEFRKLTDSRKQARDIEERAGRGMG